MILKGTFKTPEDLKGQKIATVQGSVFEKMAMRCSDYPGCIGGEKRGSLFRTGRRVS